MALHREDRLSLRLVAAGALMLLAFLPVLMSGTGEKQHPVAGYGKSIGHADVSPQVTMER